MPRTGSAAAPPPGRPREGQRRASGGPGPGHRGTRGGGAGRDFHTRLVLCAPRRGGWERSCGAAGAEVTCVRALCVCRCGGVGEVAGGESESLSWSA